MAQTLQQIRNTAIATGGFSDPVLTKQYLEAGGTLSNNAIPRAIAPIGKEIRPITVDDLMSSPTPIPVPTSAIPSTGSTAVSSGQTKIDSFQAPNEDDSFAERTAAFF